MAIEQVKETYSGKIREVELGTGAKAVKVGGAGAYPFYWFEGVMGNPPRIAWEMWDAGADDWPEAAKEPFADVLGDPPAWAKKLQDDFNLGFWAGVLDRVINQITEDHPQIHAPRPQAASLDVQAGGVGGYAVAEADRVSAFF